MKTILICRYADQMIPDEFLDRALSVCHKNLGFCIESLDAKSKCRKLTFKNITVENAKQAKTVIEKVQVTFPTDPILFVLSDTEPTTGDDLQPYNLLEDAEGNVIAVVAAEGTFSAEFNKPGQPQSQAFHFVNDYLKEQSETLMQLGGNIPSAFANVLSSKAQMKNIVDKIAMSGSVAVLMIGPTMIHYHKGSAEADAPWGWTSHSNPDAVPVATPAETPQVEQPVKPKEKSPDDLLDDILGTTTTDTSTPALDTISKTEEVKNPNLKYDNTRFDLRFPPAKTKDAAGLNTWYSQLTGGFVPSDVMKRLPVLQLKKEFRKTSHDAFGKVVNMDGTPIVLTGDPAEEKKVKEDVAPLKPTSVPEVTPATTDDPTKEQKVAAVKKAAEGFLQILPRKELDAWKANIIDDKDGKVAAVLNANSGVMGLRPADLILTEQKVPTLAEQLGKPSQFVDIGVLSSWAFGRMFASAQENPQVTAMLLFELVRENARLRGEMARLVKSQSPATSTKTETTSTNPPKRAAVGAGGDAGLKF